MRCGTRCSGIVSIAADVLWISVMKGVGGVCGICLARRGWRGGRVDERVACGLYQSRGNRGNVGRVSVFGWGVGLDQGLKRWGGTMSV